MKDKLDKIDEVNTNLDYLLDDIFDCRQKLAAGVEVKKHKKALHNIGANIVVHGVRLMKAMK